MAFITNDGKVLQAEPWGRRSVTFFLGIIQLVFTFFRSLFSPIEMMLGANSDDSQRFGHNTRDYRPGSGPPRPPSRRLGRPNTGSNIYTPGPCGGCCG